ncbi:glycosyltransferase N-terminal domain-containing protein [Desulfobacterales bacterium HSG17]|nr:glycosyltransferase N-terminal domain-containing protein [Desulfobacterales bacterium HSG17]
MYRLLFYTIMGLYLVLATLSALVIGPVCLPLLLSSEKRRKTLLARLWIGKTGYIGKKNSKPIWVHALSVGEVLSAVPLLKYQKTKRPEKDFLFSTSTFSGMQIAKERLNQWTKNFVFFPYDLPWAVLFSLAKVRPCLVIIVETDFWPLFLYVLKRAKIPLIMVNIRISQSSFRGYYSFRSLLAPLLNSAEKIFVQRNKDRMRLMTIGVAPHRIEARGDLKMNQQPDKMSEPDKKKLLRVGIINERNFVFLAGSTHPEEEEILVKGLLPILKAEPDIRIVLVPRDPNRGLEVQAITEHYGLTSQLWSTVQYGVDSSATVLIVDAIGKLAALYEICHVAFIGGSLKDFRGHNPLEAAYYGKPILFGPFMQDCETAANALLEKDGAKVIQNADELGQMLIVLYKNKDKRMRMGRAAQAVVKHDSKILEEISTEIEKVVT